MSYVSPDQEHINELRAEVAGIRGPHRDCRLVRVSTPLLFDLVARDEDGTRLTAEWGEPDEFGVYNPIITRHAADSLGTQLAAARARIAAWEPVVRAAMGVGSVTEDLRDFAMAGVDAESQQSKDASHELGRATGALVRALDAMPKEFRP